MTPIFFYKNGFKANKVKLKNSKKKIKTIFYTSSLLKFLVYLK